MLCGYSFGFNIGRRDSCYRFEDNYSNLESLKCLGGPYLSVLKKIMKKIHITFAALLLSGCTGVTFAEPKRVILATEQAYTLQYESMMIGFEDALLDANAHCQQYGKTAVNQGVDAKQGTAVTQTFKCE